MHKHLIFLIPAILLTACTYGQQPAPYNVYGTRYYGKNMHNDLPNNNPPKDNDYNSRIDAENSTRVLSHPLVENRGDPNYISSPVAGNKSGEIYSHQLSDSSGNTSRPLAPVPIDSDQQAVRLNNPHNLNPIHAGGSLASNYAADREPPHIEETVPPVEKKESFINPPEANAERKNANGLSHVRPLPKPKFQEEEAEAEPAPAAAEVAPPVKHEKPKITPKIQKVETTPANAAPKVTSKPGLLNKPAPAEEVDDAAADDSDDEDVKAAPAATAKVPPVKMAETKTAAKTEDKDDDVPEAAPAAKPEAVAKPVAKSNAQFIKPVDGVVVGEFGNDKNGSFNDGVNIQAPEGTPVKASSGGTVVYSGNQLQGYGNMIIIKHPNGYLSAYSHLKELELKKGDSVDQGKVLGHVGKTGNVDTPQLHFGIRKGREPVDPKNYISLGQ